MARVSTAAPRAGAWLFAGAEGRSAASWPHWSRALTLLHAAALATLMRPEPVHAVVLFSGAAVLMAAWRRGPARPAAVHASYELIRAKVATSEIILAPNATDGADAAHIGMDRRRVAREVQPCAFDDMLAHMSHELRTPLNALIGFADLMVAETYGPVGHPRYREYLTHIRASGASLMQSAENALAVTELLAATRGGPERSVVSLRSIVETAWNSLAELQAPGDAPPLAVKLAAGAAIGDHRVLVRAVVALFAEANSASDGKGPIAVTGWDEGASVVLRIGTLRSVRGSKNGASPQLALARLLLTALDIPLRESDDENSWSCELLLERAAPAEASPAANTAPTLPA